jgi:hypothetical protein
MKTYEIVCEGMVSRTIMVDANDLSEAVSQARKEFSLLVGAREEDVEVADIYENNLFNRR